MEALIAYSGRSLARPRYYANAHERDEVEIAPVAMPIRDARGRGTSLDVEGFELVRDPSAVTDFADRAQVMAVHVPEIVSLIKDLTGASRVEVTGAGLLRFSERSGRAGSLDNSMPARFAHIDVSPGTALTMSQRLAAGRPHTRVAQYNVWRALSAPPQDVPLALCDARSLAREDCIAADAIFDPPGGAPEWSFESYVIAANPAHRWHWFSDLTADEAIVFKTFDSDSRRATHVPHVAFDLPGCPADAPPRVSIEMRATAFWEA
jgi:hypothetical protein